MKSFLVDRPVIMSNRIAIQNMYPEDAEYIVKNLNEALPAYSLHNNTALEQHIVTTIAQICLHSRYLMGLFFF